MDSDVLATITLTWHSQHDNRTCPICKALDGHKWVFVAGKDEFPNQLTVNGQNVWDIHQGSRAHGHSKFNCRCHITSEINMEDLTSRIETLRDQLQEQVMAEGTNVQSQRGNFI